MSDDPVLARRARLARAAAAGRRAGWLLLAVAAAAFAAGFATGFNDAVTAVVAAAMAGATATLAPAIVVGYAVRAADREDRRSRAEPGR